MTTYLDTLTRIAALQAQDDDSLLPECGTRLLTHGERTARAIVLLHGYTNNPRQYRILAEQFFTLGYNVLVPRFPGHGFKDRMTTALAEQTEQGLLTFTNAVLDMHDVIALLQIGEIDVEKRARGLGVRRLQTTRALDLVTAENLRVGDHHQICRFTAKAPRQRTQMRRRLRLGGGGFLLG